MKKEFKGLKKLRSGSGRKPTFKCENCGCMRFSQCRCQKKYIEPVEPVV